MAKHVAAGWVLIFVAAGCATYVTPRGGAPMGALGVTQQMRDAGTDGVIRQAFDKKPLATFPTSVIVARVQQSGYVSRTADGFGSGQYSVVTERDIEKPEHLARIGKLAMVNGVAGVNRAMLPNHFQSDIQLRQAAAQLQAGILIIYTLDTRFTDVEKAAVLGTITLGLSPTRKIRVSSTASAVIMDSRNGYIYGLAEATEKQDRFASSWSNEAAIDDTRRTTESAAFEKLIGEVETTWNGVVTRYATPASAAVPEGSKKLPTQ